MAIRSKKLPVVENKVEEPVIDAIPVQSEPEAVTLSVVESKVEEPDTSGQELTTEQQVALEEIERLMAQVQELRKIAPAPLKVKKTPKNVGVGAMVYDLIAKGFTNKEILQKVCDHYGNNNTTYACVSWYRNNSRSK